MPRLHGIDVSTYQGQPDWRKLRAAGLTFAAIKATEGVTVRDPQFPRNWDRAGNTDFARFAYHFLHPSAGGVEQADFLHQYVRQHGTFLVGDGVLLDLEVTDGLRKDAAILAAEQFVTRARQSIYKQVVLYTNPDTWRRLGEPRSEILSSCPLWLADYGVLVPPREANLPSPAFWQYSSSGIEPGIHGDVDLDLFFGDMTQLYQLLRFP